LLVVASGAGVAWAGVTFQAGNHPQPDEQNILLFVGTTSATVFGETDTTHATVGFSSITDVLTELSNGQARFGAEEGLRLEVT
jgi:hypothetical protein